MKFYYAPMEGITLYPLRNVHREIFGDTVDRYFTPFVTAPKTFHFKNREKKDILPDKNKSFADYGKEIVPQIMAGNAETFLWAAREMKKLGYNEVNLNLGCPAPTVVNRHKGAGLLRDTEYLDEMLGRIFDEVSKDAGSRTDIAPANTRTGPIEDADVVSFVKSSRDDETISSPKTTSLTYADGVSCVKSYTDDEVAISPKTTSLTYADGVSRVKSNTDDEVAASPTPTFLADPNKSIYPKISIKTRLGFYSEDEAPQLMTIFAKYPINELIIHARLREDYYAGNPRTEAFWQALSAYRNAGGKADICYNGNINSPQDFTNIMNPETNANKTVGGISSVMIGRGLLSDPALVRRIKGGSALLPKELRLYLDSLYEGYAEYIPEERNVIFKMLEHWAFLHVHFENCDKYLKSIRKSRTKGEYFAAVNNIFSSCRFI